MSYPLSDFVITSAFGWRIHPITGDQKYHCGCDLGCDYGDTVKAAYDGVVTNACWISGYGYTVIIDHGNGITTLYGHNQGFYVSEGQSVRQGQPIAAAGSTGNSTGPHCHFEVREYGKVVNPGDYIDGLNELQNTLGSYSDGSATDFNDKALTLELAADFAKPLRDFAEQIGAIFEKSISLIKDLVWQIFIILALIDFALGFMYKTIEEDGVGFFEYFLYKVSFLGILIFFFTNWGEYIGTFALNSFPALGSVAGGSTLDETGKILSDPTTIVQKGLYIIVPIINEALQLEAPTSFGAIIRTVISFANPMDNIIRVVCLIFGVILFFCFILIGIEILMAYIYFYATILFSFTGFMFSSLKQTRKYASNGLNGIFAASLTLMFFCLFSVMLSTTMEKLTLGDFISSQTITSSEIGSTTQIQSLEECIVRIKKVESYGGVYDIYNKEGSGAYGAYQQMPEYWDHRCENYIAAGGTAHLASECDNNPPNAPKTKYSWCPENQDRVSEYQLLCLYDQYGDWNKCAAMWNPNDPNYINLILNTSGVNEIKTRILAIEKLMQLTLIVLIFIFMADRISKMIQKNFGGMGFKLTNEG